MPLLLGGVAQTAMRASRNDEYKDGPTTALDCGAMDRQPKKAPLRPLARQKEITGLMDHQNS